MDNTTDFLQNDFKLFKENVTDFLSNQNFNVDYASNFVKNFDLDNATDETVTFVRDFDVEEALQNVSNDYPQVLQNATDFLTNQSIQFVKDQEDSVKNATVVMVKFVKDYDVSEVSDKIDLLAKDFDPTKTVQNATVYMIVQTTTFIKDYQVVDAIDQTATFVKDFDLQEAIKKSSDMIKHI